MKSLPYFKWYPADAETDENFKAMSDAEVGLYLRCLNHSWLNGGLPADLGERAKALQRTKAYVDRHWTRVGRCFVLSVADPTRLVNPRQEEERVKAIAKSEKNKRPGNANASGSRQGRVLRASESESESGSGSDPEPETENQHNPEQQSTPLELAIEQTAAAIHRRHPAIRRCGISEVREKLRAIARKLPAAEKIPKLNAINAFHAGWCQTEQWTKGGGEYAKGLDNWLAPTKNRYDVPPPSEEDRPETKLEKLMRERDEQDRKSAEEESRIDYNAPFAAFDRAAAQPRQEAEEP